MPPLGPAGAYDRAIRFRPPEDTDPVLIRADETALPATESDAEVTWFVRDETDAAPDFPLALGLLRADRLPPAQRPYVWTAGASDCVKRLRRVFADEHGTDRRRVTFLG